MNSRLSVWLSAHSPTDMVTGPVTNSTTEPWWIGHTIPFHLSYTTAIVGELRWGVFLLLEALQRWKKRRNARI